MTVRRLYLATVFFGAAGALALLPTHGIKYAATFLLGAAASLGNLYLFNYLTRIISPTGGEKKPWKAGAFISRYFLLLAGGYVIVKALNVGPLPVVLGLLASTAAVLASSIFEFIQSFFTKSTTH